MVIKRPYAEFYIGVTVIPSHKQLKYYVTLTIFLGAFYAIYISIRNR